MFSRSVLLLNCFHVMFMRKPFPNATPPIGKIHSFSKLAIPFEPVIFLISFVIYNFLGLCKKIYFKMRKAISNCLSMAAP